MNKSVKIIIIAVVAVLVLGGLFAYLDIATDLFKSKEQLFAEYSKDLLKKVETFSENKVLDEYLNKKGNLPYQNSGRIDVSLLANTDTPNNGTTLLEFSGKVDNPNQKQEENITLHYSDTVNLPISFVRNGNKFGFSSSEIMKAYAVINNENLKEFAKKINMPDSSIPNSINSDARNSINLSTEEAEGLLQKYTNVIKQHLTKDNFSKDNSESEYPGYVLTIPKDVLYATFNDLINNVKNDQIIIREYKNMQNDTTESVEDYIKTIETFRQSINKEIQKSESDLVITVRGEKNGAQHFSVAYDKYLYQIYASNNSIQFILSEKNGDSYDNVLDVTVNKANAEESVKYNISVNVYKEIENGVTDLDKGSAFISFEVVRPAGDASSELFDIKLETNNSTFILVYKNDIEFKNGIEITELTNTNSVVLNDLSKETLNSTINQLLNRIIELNVQKYNQAQDSENPNSGINYIISSIMLFTQNASKNPAIVDQSSLQESAVQMFNQNFVNYGGEQQGSRIKALIRTVQAKNSTFDNDLRVSINGIDSEEELSSLIETVNISGTYQVSFEYDANGYVKNILIK